MTTARDPSAQTRALPPWVIAAVLLGILALASWLTTRSTLWDRDEPRFAQAAVEMVHSGQWIFPTFNGELRPDKPILIYWLMAIPVSLFGVSEWAVRAWAPIGLAVSAWLTWRVGRRFLSPSAALLAPLILAHSPMAVAEGTVATVDSVLMACITAAMACFAGMLANGWRTRDFLVLALCLGAAQLTKGPVGLAVPMLSIFTALWFLRGKSAVAPGFSARLGIAVVLSVLVFLAWAIPANNATGGEFAARGLGKHVGGRMLQPMEGHGGNYWLGLFFYLPVIALGFAPWILQLPAALVALWNGKIGDAKQRALLLGWSLAPFCLMTLVATKLAHYVMPILPALALAVAAVIDAAERGALAPRELRWLARGAWIFGVVLALEVAAVIVLSLRPEAAALRGPVLALGAVILAQGAVAIALHVKQRWRHAAIAAIAGGVAVWLVLGGFVLPRVEALKIAPRMVAAIRAAGSGSLPLATYSFEEPSLNFYWGPTPIRRLPDGAAIDAWLAETADGVLVIPQAKRNVLEGRAGAKTLREVASVDGFNYSKGKPLKLVALLRQRE